ncbi:MAG: hypothetical protein ACREP6_07385 [Candidatus Binataceae bacterium]
MTFRLHTRTRRFVVGLVAIWCLVGLEIGVFYAHTPSPILIPVILIAALIELMITTLLFMRLDEEPIGFAAILYNLLLLAALIVGTITLLMMTYFQAGG